jgi:hypothetical protein
MSLCPESASSVSFVPFWAHVCPTPGHTFRPAFFRPFAASYGPNCWSKFSAKTPFGLSGTMEDGEALPDTAAGD